ncbi:uncharacterized protein LOC129579983 [Sitodiplosis mosellana]|uniref:uncharacterized protein LOC129579983 n=1 Tax=Sitodiplosis mosellana TaxID=263140 RepID=UPI00244527AD|nr:uncharacterized protein LOC129579983 [Sitodiplosis mosellana]
MDERKQRVKQARASVRLSTQGENRARRERVTLENLFYESFNEELPYPLTEIPLHRHEDYHIPFKTAKWQEWWGEGFYRRDGNDTPRSLEPEVTALQELFAGVKRRHQENNLQWRKDLTEYLLVVETACSKPPELSDEYINFPGTFDIPFKSDEYKYWWDRCIYDENNIPTYMYEN